MELNKMHYKFKATACEHGKKPSGFMKRREILD
jgi:hypothetical protein